MARSSVTSIGANPVNCLREATQPSLSARVARPPRTRPSGFWQTVPLLANDFVFLDGAAPSYGLKTEHDDGGQGHPAPAPRRARDPRERGLAVLPLPQARRGLGRRPGRGLGQPARADARLDG